MPYGGVGFEEVWRYQIGCMMAGQYSALLDAMDQKSRKGVMAVCLRLGWNDAFKHVSENKDKLTDTQKLNAVEHACKALVTYFEEYAKQVSTESRVKYINECLKETEFVAIFEQIKKVDSETYPLCLGHVQKMFNIAIKLLLCLIVSAEHATAIGMCVKLGKCKENDVILNDGLLSYANFPFAFETADCPIDHIILERMDAYKTSPSPEIFGPKKRKKYASIVWSKMGKQEDEKNYNSAQSKIALIHKGTTKSNLCFDFENWK